MPHQINRKLCTLYRYVQSHCQHNRSSSKLHYEYKKCYWNARWTLPTHSKPTRNLLSPMKNGFRPFQSTTDNLVFLQHHIFQAFAKQHFLTTYFNYTKAFDTIQQANIVQQLLQLNISGKMTTFIQNFLLQSIFSVHTSNSRHYLLTKRVH